MGIGGVFGANFLYIYCMMQTKSQVGGIVCILLEIEIQLVHARGDNERASASES